MRVSLARRGASQEEPRFLPELDSPTAKMLPWAAWEREEMAGSSGRGRGIARAVLRYRSRGNRRRRSLHGSVDRGDLGALPSGLVPLDRRRGTTRRDLRTRDLRATLVGLGEPAEDLALRGNSHRTTRSRCTARTPFSCRNRRTGRRPEPPMHQSVDGEAPGSHYGDQRRPASRLVGAGTIFGQRISKRGECAGP